MNNRILAVDDEQNILDSLKRQMRKHFDLETAQGPSAGLEAIRSGGPFAVILSDLRMPVMDGIEFLQRAAELAPDSVRIMLTGDADLQNAIQAVNQGNIYRFLTKPCSRDGLIAVLNQGVEQYRLVAAEKALKKKNEALIEVTRKQNLELKEFNASLEEKVRERTREVQEKNEILKRFNNALENSVANTIRLLSSLVESLSPDLGKHMKRVAIASKKVAEALGLDPKQIETIEIAAMVHDLGLIGASEKIWQKDERELPASEVPGYRHHPMIASVCLEPVESLVEVRNIVAHHHERFDGNGYPGGLKGNDIPVGSRIIGVVGDFFRIIGYWPESFVATKRRAACLIGDDADNVSFNDMNEYIEKIKEAFLIKRAGSFYDPDVVAKILENRAVVLADGDPFATNSCAVHYDALKVGMKLALPVHTRDGRFVLAGGTALNKSLVDGLKKLAAGHAICKTLHIFDPENSPGAKFGAGDHTEWGP